MRTLLLMTVVLFVSATLATQLKEAEEEAAPGCDRDGVHYGSGDRVPHPDKCAWCSCRGGHISCVMTQCAFPQCVDSVESENSCCRTCPNGENCRTPEGIIPFGETWTESRGEYCVAKCRCRPYRHHATCKLQCNFPESRESNSTDD
ncbi:hypothetical protein CAPTEDRAFT_227923 [Capitella teleta]|uniref:VWFC domain-containing protein n=1 Tax=Capitella teleta TaxID=283909 RepID=R7TL81_CAPTE|nr:hypothetical protein CAPTEDRAFT_227923 [Capitella teleta]|eukprot:ELT94272.1 hypothetical protein CAPTEDRAFT_227923 [Capitella teleta]